MRTGTKRGGVGAVLLQFFILIKENLSGKGERIQFLDLLGITWYGLLEHLVRASLLSVDLTAHQSQRFTGNCLIKMKKHSPCLSRGSPLDYQKQVICMYIVDM